jgi:hypothetical protein
MDLTSPEKVECPDFSASKARKDVAGKKYHTNVVLDARSKDCDIRIQRRAGYGVGIGYEYRR